MVWGITTSGTTIHTIAMGAKYARSFANWYMTQWEKEVIYDNRPDQLIMYRRYIDDILTVWAGDRDSVLYFRQNLNTNGKYSCHGG